MRVCLCVHPCSLKRVVNYNFQLQSTVVYKMLTYKAADLFNGNGWFVKLADIYLKQDKKNRIS